MLLWVALWKKTWPTRIIIISEEGQDGNTKTPIAVLCHSKLVLLQLKLSRTRWGAKRRCLFIGANSEQCRVALVEINEFSLNVIVPFSKNYIKLVLCTLLRHLTFHLIPLCICPLPNVKTDKAETRVIGFTLMICYCGWIRTAAAEFLANFHENSVNRFKRFALLCSTISAGSER